MHSCQDQPCWCWHRGRVDVTIPQCEVGDQDVEDVTNECFRYANFLYWSSLLDAKQRDECLAMEMETQRLIDEKQL